MKRSDATVLAVVAVVGLIAVFWFAVLAPKRNEASTLESQANDLQSQLQQQQQTVTTAEQAKANFAPSYHKLVVLGKAVPADSEQASLLVQLNTLATRAGVSFRSLDLSQDVGAGAAPVTPAPTTPAPTTPTTPTDTTSTDTTSTDTTSTSTTSTTPTTGAPTPTASTAVPVAPTEAAASTLPLGTTIGEAGLPVMPYQLTFTGGYFQISRFLHEVDSLVHTRGTGVTVSGRLVTVNSFDLAPPAVTSATDTGVPQAAGQTLEAQLSVTTYVTPADQGLTGGATPTAPVAPTSATAVPTAAPAPTTP